MARITIEIIKEELSKIEWKVLTSEYTNLDTPMTFQCPEGHQVFTTWKKLRNKQECPVCEQNTYKIADQKIIPKKGKHRVLAIDQASHICGWAVFDDKELVKYGYFKTSDDDEVVRINKLKQWFISMITNWQPDLIGIEDIQYQDEVDKKVKMGVTVFKTLARLQGVFLDTCYELKIPFEVCHTGTWRTHCGVKGKHRPDKKRSMQLLAKKWYDITVSEDEADAIGIGKYLSEKRAFLYGMEDFE